MYRGDNNSDNKTTYVKSKCLVIMNRIRKKKKNSLVRNEKGVTYHLGESNTYRTLE